MGKKRLINPQYEGAMIKVGVKTVIFGEYYY